MSQLSAQSIMAQCVETKRPMISPFSAEKQIVNGKSWGLSAASYDVRIAHDLTLGPHPGFVLLEAFKRASAWSAETQLARLADRFAETKPPTALAHTIEDFIMPHNVAGYVCDKSSFARVFVSAFNTLFDPGFEGNATLELVNLGPETVEIKAGDPICQLVFHWLDEDTDRPYCGKYMHQGKRPIGAMYEQPQLPLVAKEIDTTVYEAVRIEKSESDQTTAWDVGQTSSCAAR